MNRGMTEKESNALRKAENGVWSRVSAYVIVKGKEWGKIKVAHPLSFSGKVQVWVWDSKGYAGCGWAIGCGFDLVGEAIKDIVYDQLVLSVDWKTALEHEGYIVIQAI